MVKGGKRLLMKRPSSNPKSGTHTINGVLIASGPNIRKGSSISKACIYDVAPTILHLLGLPVPSEMDGRVLNELYELGSEAAQRVVEYSGYDQGEKKRIREKLARLRGSGKL
jgi:hypothetical protein